MQIDCVVSVVTASSRSQGRCLALVVTVGRWSRSQLQRARVTLDLPSRKDTEPSRKVAKNRNDATNMIKMYMSKLLSITIYRAVYGTILNRLSSPEK
ncbi:hypothetical protein KSZ_61570 [Dictyobacter formicarum]|uniref:Uncharacterized protein n=1 Tax=Dictyobacter formicarum TaxID=2778368 RepID=A0ABQ3VS48_9CHLR|nr:hypothetical protein KSZ_61570 [Dictyobacter formicarum]